MVHLLKIDLKKLVSYRTFWVVCGLYFITLAFTTASGMEFLKWLARTFEGFGSSLNINRIPIYHFPDVWLNLIYFSGFFKIILGIMTVISITNEFQYRTLRQNVIDGLSRWQFLASKILTNVLLSFLSVAMIMVISFATGLIYTPAINWTYVFADMEFLIAYFIEIFAFLSFALMLGVFIQRSGLTIILLLLARMLELIIRENIDEYVPWMIQFLPLESIANLVPMPLERYAFQEIRDYLTISSIAIALGWTFLFNYFSYLKLKKSDI
jgi:ABC-type transport system involved in multi-copper enzyme maturation permease subunit